MSLSLTIEDYTKRLDLLKIEVERIVADAPFVQSYQVVGLLTRRIFNLGQDTAGKDIGQYDDKRKQTFLSNRAKPALTKRQQVILKKQEFLSTNKKGDITGITYKQLRKLRGLRVDKVDLQFTGALLASIANAKTPTGAIIGFRNLQESKIAGYLEKKYKKPIFKPSETEQQQAKGLMVQYVAEEMQVAIQTIFK